MAHPCDASSLTGAVEAAELGLLTPILVGPRAKIEAAAKQCGKDISRYQLVDTPHSQASAEAAVRLVREGKAELLMKGSLHTDELMSAVVSRETGLRTGRRISHCFVMDLPALDRPIIITDAAVNMFPTLEDKVHIIQNAIDFAQVLGKPQPKVALLSAIETVIAKVPTTIEAGALCKRHRARCARSYHPDRRADSVLTRLASCAVSVLVAKARKGHAAKAIG